MSDEKTNEGDGAETDACKIVELHEVGERKPERSEALRNPYFSLYATIKDATTFSGGPKETFDSMKAEEEKALAKQAEQYDKCSAYVLALALFSRERSTCPKRFAELLRTAEEIVGMRPDLDLSIMGSHWLLSDIRGYFRS